ncbi:MAG: cysteine synthase A [Candidatus Tokpelaia sp.]|nr:MAG: cysteine synthase A [Candidatus Tokpelaia sp.]KAA6206210.1 MAG: cysteine synthase A [Candidatus Tokpelaia sp.]
MAQQKTLFGKSAGRGRIYDSVLETIGDTPLVRARNFARQEKLGADLLLKLEFFNPLASVKDRIGIAMIAALEKQARAVPGKTVLIEPTSGNTGIALAFAAAVKGYRLILTMPETMSIERRKLLKLLGAELVITEGAQGMKGAIAKAEELLKQEKHAIMPQQFENMANPQQHYQTTGPEIWHDSQGKIDFLVAGIGTGGTISGAGKYLKEQKPSVQIIAVEPQDSPVLSGGAPGPHKIQGIGAGFVPKVLDTDIYDEIITIGNEEAVASARLLAKTEGIAAGISAGAVVAAAVKLGRRAENKGKIIVTIIPDFAERYLSTALFAGITE